MSIMSQQICTRYKTATGKEMKIKLSEFFFSTAEMTKFKICTRNKNYKRGEKNKRPKSRHRAEWSQSETHPSSVNHLVWHITKSTESAHVTKNTM